MSGLVITIVVARSVPTVDFGIFAAITGFYLFARGLSAAMCSETFLVGYSTAGKSEALRAGSAVISSALAMGLVVGVLVALFAFTLPQIYQAPSLAMALGLPFLLAHDSMRFVFIGNARPDLAMALDSGWLVLQVVLVQVALTAFPGAVTPAMVAWSLSAAITVGIALALSGHRVRVHAVRDWAKEAWGTGWKFSVEYVIGTGLAPLILLICAAIAGPAAAAALRVAAVLMGPFRILLLAAIAIGISEGSRIKEKTPESSIFRFGMLVSAILSVAAAAWTAGLMAIPDSFGRQMFGETWVSASTLFLVMGLGSIGAALQSGMLVGLRVNLAVNRSLWLRIVVAPVTLALGIGGTSASGAFGAAVGLTIGTALGAVLTAWQCFVADRDRRTRLRT